MKIFSQHPFSLPVLSALLALCFSPDLRAYGFDTGKNPRGTLALVNNLNLTPQQSPWLRLRGLGETRTEGDWDKTTIAQSRAQLAELRDKNFKLCVLIIWHRETWKSGVRPGGGNRLPLDLREARERARHIAANYSDLVDAWEIYNEPDIDFLRDNPEHYAAFFKAIAHGLRQGHAENKNIPPARQVAAPLIVMAPLAMPPGPYLRQLLDNDLLNHTDALNYHYYGYPEDFTGVHQQFQNALATHRPQTPQNSFSLKPFRKRLPVFITEYGYGLLTPEARKTVEGRVNQWRFFSSVAQQIKTLRIEAPMAFLLNPYLEYKLNEFGLTATAENGGNLSYTPADFSLETEQAWMRRINQTVGENLTITPALAHLLDHAEKNPAKPRPLATLARAPSPIVIDLIVTKDFTQDKQAAAYRVQNAIATTHRATAILYNFSDHPVTGTLLSIGLNSEGGACSPSAPPNASTPKNSHATQGAPAHAPAPGTAGILPAPSSPNDAQASPQESYPLPATRYSLLPNQRLEIPLTLTIPETTYRANKYQLHFIPDKPPSRFIRSKSRRQPFSFQPSALSLSPDSFSTQFYPALTYMRPKLITGFTHPTATQTQQNLLARPLATGEHTLHPQNRWLVTDGVRVEESTQANNTRLWRFQIDKLPPEPLRPAAAELPLPSGFAIPTDAVLLYNYRLSASAEKGILIDTYIRTENGNLYTVQPPVWATANWKTYRQPAAAFTMGFFARAKLPWQFFQNRPAALVFYFRPRTVPLTVEIAAPRLVRFEE